MAGPSSSLRRVEWKYDAMGRRVRQTSYVLSNGLWQVVEDLKFVSDPELFGRHVAELNATNNALVRVYIWGLDLSETLDGAGGVGGLLWVRMATGPAAGTHFVSYDGNGNVWNLVSATGGTETARYEYGPFGEPLRLSGPPARTDPFRFSTKRTEDFTGLVLYEYRAYSPSSGRWLSRDPIEELGAVVMMFETKDLERIKRILPASPEARHILLGNRYYLSKLAALNSSFAFGGATAASVKQLYVFVGNDPILGYDPDGNVAQWVGACGVGCVIGGIGGFFGGISGGWKGAACGALGGALNGCCSAVICTTMPQFCVAGSCICGAIGSFAEQLCMGGFNYKDKCAWAALVSSGIVGCLGGVATVSENAKAQLIQFVTGVDIASLTALCGKF